MPCVIFRHNISFVSLAASFVSLAASFVSLAASFVSLDFFSYLLLRRRRMFASLALC